MNGSNEIFLVQFDKKHKQPYRVLIGGIDNIIDVLTINEFINMTSDQILKKCGYTEIMKLNRDIYLTKFSGSEYACCNDNLSESVRVHPIL
jgi:hypothetical protein